MPSMYARACAVTRAASAPKLRPLPTMTGLSGLIPTSTTGARSQSMPAVAQHERDPPRLDLGDRHVVGVAQLLMRQRARVAGRRGEAHDPSALGVHRDQHRASGARPGPRGDPVRELCDLVRIDHVAPEQQHAADARIAQQPIEVRVALAGRAGESDEQQIAQTRDERGHPRGIRRSDRAAPHERHGDRDDDQQRASGRPRAPTTQLGLFPQPASRSGWRRRGGGRGRGRRGRRRRRRA